MNRPTNAQKQLLELIQMSVGAREALSCCPDSLEEWRRVMEKVADQGLMGVLYPVVEKLDDDGLIPKDAYYSWWKVSEDIRRFGKRQREMSARLWQNFTRNGFRSCILKGAAAALLYPDPLLRTVGDIDIWVEGDRRVLVDFLRERVSLRKVVYHHCDFSLSRTAHVEVHFTPSWMNSWGANRRLQRWFCSVAPEQFSHFDADAGFCVPTLAFEGVYFLLHIYRHVLEEGMGLRQMLDYFYLLRKLTLQERERIRTDLKQLHLLRFARAVMYVMQEAFGLDDAFLLCPPDPKEGAFLLESALQAGNFGQADARNAHSADETLMGHGWRKLRRNARLLRHYPSEVAAMPFFMVWQYLWRRRNGYLYNGR